MTYMVHETRLNLVGADCEYTYKRTPFEGAWTNAFTDSPAGGAMLLSTALTFFCPNRARPVDGVCCMMASTSKHISQSN
jgi:hypothetical protein